MKKLLGLLLAVGVLVGLAGSAMAVNPDVGYLVVRCTVSISVDVVDVDNTVAIVDAAGVPAAGVNEIWFSTYVRVRNDSDGTLTNWSVYISTQQQASAVNGPWSQCNGSYVEWTYGTDLNDVGINKVSLACVITTATVTTVTDGADFNTNDMLSVTTGLRYEVSGGRFDPATVGRRALSQYPIASNYNMTSPTEGLARRMFFRVRTPSAVTDDNFRRFTIAVNAAASL